MGSPEDPNAYPPIDREAVKAAIEKLESDRDGTFVRQTLERFGEESDTHALINVMIFATGQEVRYDSISQVRDVPASSLVVAGFALAYEILRPGQQSTELPQDAPASQPPETPA